MFTLDCTTDPKKFLATHGAVLDKNRGTYNLIIALCHAAVQKAEDGGNAGTQFYTLSKDNNVQLFIMCTPPYNLIFSKTDNTDGFDFLAHTLHAQGESFPGIVGPPESCAAFVAAWRKETGQVLEFERKDTIYTLETVLPVRKTKGAFRFATEEDTTLIAKWFINFRRESLSEAEWWDEKTALENTRQDIEEKSIALWVVDNTPVCMAGYITAPQLARITSVYTPDDMRGKGYASALTAQISQHLLDTGIKTCCLYADKDNPAPNAVYKKIGYTPVEESQCYTFNKAD